MRTHRALLALALLAPAASSQAVVAIHHLQGAAHRSPLAGDRVAVEGLVTSVAGALVTLQTVPGSEDGDDATSQALFVELGSGPAVQPGDLLRVSGRVKEFNPRGDDGQLTRTQLFADRAAEVLGRRDLPAPIVLGRGGRLVPTEAIDDTRGTVDGTSGNFDPARDALDFFESLEAMRVAFPDGLVVGPTSGFGEIVLVADGGAASKSLHGPALVISEGDFNPERVVVKSGRFDGARFDAPRAAAGTRFGGAFIGVLGYDYGHFKLFLTEAAPAVSAAASPLPAVPPVAAGQLRFATYNAENFSIAGPAARVQAVARQIVADLGAPDLVALQEVQDDSGPADDGVTSSERTLAALVEAIDGTGGPAYAAFDIAPRDGADGGQPGGNIRVAFLARTDSALEAVHARGGAADTPVEVQRDAAGRPRLSHSPGRLSPGAAAWSHSRVPLVLELRLRGQPIFVIACHLNSKGGDGPLFGARQPPDLPSEARRLEQVAGIAAFVGELRAMDPAAAVLVLGDLNDFAFSQPLRRLVLDGGLTNLTDTLPAGERWTYIYQGNAQALDHVLVSSGLVDLAGGITRLDYRIAHLNAVSPDGVSDHDPCVLTLTPASSETR